jgi:hypothetical protein
MLTTNGHGNTRLARGRHRNKNLGASFGLVDTIGFCAVEKSTFASFCPFGCYISDTRSRAGIIKIAAGVYLRPLVEAPLIAWPSSSVSKQYTDNETSEL